MNNNRGAKEDFLIPYLYIEWDKKKTLLCDFFNKILLISIARFKQCFTGCSSQFVFPSTKMFEIRKWSFINKKKKSLRVPDDDFFVVMKKLYTGEMGSYSEKQFNYKALRSN